MADLINEFSWSMSRSAKFEACARAYYYHYYGSWGGWEAGADPEVRERWILKKLTSRFAWAGSTVHDTIAWALEQVAVGRGLPEADAAVERMHRRMRQEFRDSREGVYRRRKALGLLEHEYDEALDDEVWRGNWEHAAACLETFYRAPVLQEILSVDPGRWFPIDALDTFDFEGVKVYVAPDFAFRDAADRTRILDWKTGRPKARDRDQVLGYALFALDRWGVRAPQIAAELHYLGAGEVDEVPVTEDALDAFRDRLRASIETMRARLADPGANRAELGAFPPTDDPGECARCNFRKVCPDAALDAPAQAS